MASKAGRLKLGDAGFITIAGFCWIKLKMGSPEQTGPLLRARGLAIGWGVDIAWGVSPWPIMPLETPNDREEKANLRFYYIICFALFKNRKLGKVNIFHLLLKKAREDILNWVEKGDCKKRTFTTWVFNLHVELAVFIVY